MTSSTQHFPLYHGQVPANGSMSMASARPLKDARGQGMKATVKAELTSGLGHEKITAMNFAVTLPPVRIGTIQLVRRFGRDAGQSQILVAGQSGNDFDTENSAIGLQHAFEDLYQDQGYAAVQVQVTQV